MTRQQHIDYLIAHIIDRMAQFLMEDFRLDTVSALDVIYNSGVYSLLQDEKTGLYIQSPSYVYELLKKEYLTAAYR